MTKILNRAELGMWVRSLPFSIKVAILLGGDRLSCCDQAVATMINGQIVAVATISSSGEDYSGQPAIVALYVLPKFRRQGIGQQLMETAVKHCRDKRKFQTVRVDVTSSYAANIIQKLPSELTQMLEIHSHGDDMDYLLE